ncbi:hypothetical protein [Nitrosomonas sp. ANs5]|uniref:hypothetical protein n=1 Tax=Nitrosomonas sp. ANs5 TaxID=3423941 RepID=UPI003D33D835
MLEIDLLWLKEVIKAKAAMRLLVVLTPREMMALRRRSPAFSSKYAIVDGNAFLAIKSKQNLTVAYSSVV